MSSGRSTYHVWHNAWLSSRAMKQKSTGASLLLRFSCTQQFASQVVPRLVSTAGPAAFPCHTRGATQRARAAVSALAERGAVTITYLVTSKAASGFFWTAGSSWGALEEVSTAELCYFCCHYSLTLQLTPDLCSRLTDTKLKKGKKQKGLGNT